MHACKGLGHFAICHCVFCASSPGSCIVLLYTVASAAPSSIMMDIQALAIAVLWVLSLRSLQALHVTPPNSSYVRHQREQAELH